MILHRLHIMSYTMFLEVQVNVSITSEEPLGLSIYSSEQPVKKIIIVMFAFTGSSVSTSG